MCSVFGPKPVKSLPERLGSQGPWLLAAPTLLWSYRQARRPGGATFLKGIVVNHLL